MSVNGLTKANKETKCPYCGDERSKPATRQYRCKACGETIYVKRTVDNPQKRPMTYGQAQKAQEERDAFYADKVEKNYILRNYATQKTMTTSYIISAISHPDVNHFKIHAGHSTCSECEKLVGKILRANKHNIKNMPIPNERCLNPQEGISHCGLYLTAMFDDELTAQDYDDVILEYVDYIDGIVAHKPNKEICSTQKQDKSTFEPKVMVNRNEYITSGSDQVDKAKLETIRRISNIENNKKPPRKNISTVILANLIIWPIVLVIFTYLLTPSSNTNINPAQNQTQAEEITAYMENNFGVPGYTASWYIDIDEIRINQKETNRYIEVLTTLEKRQNTAGKNICGAVSNYWINHKNDFSGIRIVGIGEAIISYRYSLSGNCQ